MLFLSFLLVQVGFAQVVCSSELVYVVTKGEQKEEFVYKILSAEGDQEDHARQALKEKIAVERTFALKACKDTHENVSFCIAAKIQSAQEFLSKAGVATKKAFEEAVVDDCKRQVGVCSLKNVEDVKCFASISKQQDGTGHSEQESKDKTGDKKNK